MSNKVLVETSARHIHVTREALDILFGKDYKLTPKKYLSQPGQFACQEKVDIVGPKRTLSGVSILGPERSYTQVELSLTDARAIGVSAPIRESGDIENTPGCKLIGPAGELEISSGVIVAKRHIHATPSDAERLGLTDKQVVSLRVETENRSTVFDDVVVRVSKSAGFAAHFDTDEANAAAMSGDVYGEIIA